MFFWMNDAIRQTKYNKEKEKDSFLVNTIIQTNIESKGRDCPKSRVKRMLLCTSCRKSRGSITVEVSLILPLFLLGLLCIIYLMEIMAIQITIRNGMYQVAYETASSGLSTSVVTHGQMEKELVKSVGKERLERGIIVGGSQGLNTSESKVNYGTGVIEFDVKYKVRLPVPQFKNLGLVYEEKVRFKRWTGYNAGLYVDGARIVYITENQAVYHTRYNCSYLQLSIKAYRSEEIQDLRNESGGKYGACGVCEPTKLEDISTLYVTDTGSSYHSSLSCSGLKRTINSVLLEDIIGKGVCHRCGD